MVNFAGFVTFTIVVGLVKMCSGSPIAIGEESNIAELFTNDELERALNVGITFEQLINGKTRGVTVDEMIQLFQLQRTEPIIHDNVDVKTSFDEMSRVCEIFVSKHKTATNYSSEHECHINELMESLDHIPRDVLFLYIRTGICDYLSKPFLHEAAASSFGLKLVPYMEFRFWKMKNENATGMERVTAAKELCCIYKGHDNITELKVQSTAFNLTDEEMTNFVSQWNEFYKENTSKSFEQICKVLHMKNPSKDWC
ncbi:hypothetical protein Bhyg_11104 [Pseudolycoriella hygida]|uniref:Uncharacterized protein n=1 Tax=Pseudolycoriella hygida TaxID=35572 RepID=A0A9Q0MVN8_9DIPT|nr:hypothetical protein Bhyg_11104 [Pseudolycoriella hygida]